MILCTGGAGFIGSHLVRRLMADGNQVRVLDDCSRSDLSNLNNCRCDIQLGDIRSRRHVEKAMAGVSEVFHLAYVNGTPNFYNKPDLVLDVAVKGITNVIDFCMHYGVKQLTLMSSSEVCRAKLVGPDEAIPLVIPDPHNPRYSYSAGKIISEMLAIHTKVFERVFIVRPFNIYGPGMHHGHVIPDFIAQLKSLNGGSDPAPFKILGNGSETRSFCHIDDFIDGVMLMREKGEPGIYNIGTPDEITIGELASTLAGIYGRQIVLEQANQLREGDAERRKPDISKIAALGYVPKVSLDDGLRRMLNAVPVLQEH
jgi:nucleoside-diphosphate-sugar epimerase